MAVLLGRMVWGGGVRSHIDNRKKSVCVCVCGGGSYLLLSSGPVLLLLLRSETLPFTPIRADPHHTLITEEEEDGEEEDRERGGGGGGGGVCKCARGEKKTKNFCVCASATAR